MTYRKIRPISPGAYLFRKPFGGGGGAYLKGGLSEEGAYAQVSKTVSAKGMWSIMNETKYRFLRNDKSLIDIYHIQNLFTSLSNVSVSIISLTTGGGTIIAITIRYFTLTFI